MHAANMKGTAKFNNKNIAQKKWDYRDELKYQQMIQQLAQINQMQQQI